MVGRSRKRDKRTNLESEACAALSRELKDNPRANAREISAFQTAGALPLVTAAVVVMSSFCSGILSSSRRAERVSLAAWASVGG